MKSFNVLITAFVFLNNATLQKVGDVIKQQAMKKIFFLLMTILIFFSSCQKTKFVTHVFPKRQWIGGIVNIFNGVKLHINNYTSSKHQYEQDDNYAYENPKSTTLLIPSFSSVPLQVDVPVTRQEPYSLYINDVNSSRFQADAHDGYGYLTIFFEDSGTEIIGDCVNNLACICGSPREDLSNITCLIPLTFAPKDGSVAIAAGDVTFTSDVAESGPCANNACAFFCDIFAPNRNSDMQKAIEKFVEDYVDSYSSIISALFSQSLQNLGVKGPIVAIKVLTNGDLSVEDKE